MDRTPTVVIGGGIVGLSAAHFLLARGEPVTVIERDPIGVGASSGNAGLLALGHPPLPSPGLPGRILRLLIDRTGPLYIRPRLDPSLISWMLTFLRACRRDRYDAALAVLAQMGWEAGACFRELVDGAGIECEYRPAGWTEVFRNVKAFHHGRNTAEELRRFGYRADELSGTELRRRDPVFRSEVVGAIHYPDSACANPEKFVKGLARSVEDGGGKILTGCEASRILVVNGRAAGVELNSGEEIRAGNLVLAAGAWTTRLARTAGIRIPMQAGKGYHMNLSGIPALPSTGSVLAETFVVATPMNGGLRLAGTVELSGVHLRPTQERLDQLLIGARQYLTGLDEARIESTWNGLRPLTADGLPVVGWATKVPGVFIATGHAMMGFLLGPLTGRLASEMILDGRASMDIAALRADRL